MSGRSLSAQLSELDLSASQRRVAKLVTDDPEAVAFGTVSSVAHRCQTSTPTVIRFAESLGFEGFTALRDAVRTELSSQLRTAVARVRRPPEGEILGAALATERHNVDETFARLDGTDFERAVDLLADARHVWVLASTQTSGVGGYLADELAQVRNRVQLVSGPDIRAFGTLTPATAEDVLLSLDIQRHEAWFARTQRWAVSRGVIPVVLTDRLPCRLDLTGGVGLTFACDTTSPFESQVGLMALANVLVSGVVARDRERVARRLDTLDESWTNAGAFDAPP